MIKYIFIVILLVILPSSLVLADKNAINPYIPLKDLFTTISGFHIDFSRVPIIKDVPKYIPKSGEEVGEQFNRFTYKLTDINNFFNKNELGRKIMVIIRAISRLIGAILEGIVYLVKKGLEFIH